LPPRFFKGLDFEEATILALVLVVLVLGRRAFYRPTSILEEPFAPIWAVSIAGVIATAIWVSLSRLSAYRALARSVVDVCHGWQCLAYPAGDFSRRGARHRFFAAERFAARSSEPGVADADDLENARRIIANSDYTMANAALSGDKRLLFSDDGNAFVMVSGGGPQLDCAR
jgi:phosphatidylglycerol lysyltransferase